MMGDLQHIDGDAAFDQSLLPTTRLTSLVSRARRPKASATMTSDRSLLLPTVPGGGCRTRKLQAPAVIRVEVSHHRNVETPYPE
jgi:hypothetical protein